MTFFFGQSNMFPYLGSKCWNSGIKFEGATNTQSSDLCQKLVLLFLPVRHFGFLPGKFYFYFFAIGISSHFYRLPKSFLLIHNCISSRLQLMCSQFQWWQYGKKSFPKIQTKYVQKIQRQKKDKYKYRKKVLSTTFCTDICINSYSMWWGKFFEILL